MNCRVALPVQIEDLRLLIKCVQKHPGLYDESNEFYNHTSVRQSWWEDIAGTLQMSSSAVEQRWNDLRNKFNRELQRLESTKEPSIWPLYDDMLFLQNSTIFRQSENSFSNFSNEKLSPSSVKEEDILQLSGSEIEEEAQMLVKNVIDFIKLNDERSVENVTGNALKSFTVGNNYTPITEQSNSSIDAIHEIIVKRIDNVDKKLSYLPATMTANDTFINDILSLMKDMPLSVKEQFQADMYDEIYRLRAEFIES